MGHTTYNSDGSPVQGWDETAEGETELQRTRRRYQQGRCVACGDPRRYGKKALCQSCWSNGRRFCTGCDRIVPVKRFLDARRACYDCHNAYNRQRRTTIRGSPPMSPDAVLELGRQTQIARARRKADEMHTLRDRGWTWEEIGRRYRIKAESAKTHYQRYYKGGIPRETPRPRHGLSDRSRDARRNRKQQPHHDS